jgi:hypothetical protein
MRKIIFVILSVLALYPSSILADVKQKALDNLANKIAETIPGEGITELSLNYTR